MASNTNAPTTKGNEKPNAEGIIETKVETVDYRSSAGQGQEPTKENVEVIHQTLPGKNSGTGAGGGALAGATAAVTNTFQSAKDAISGKKNNTEECTK